MGLLMSVAVKRISKKLGYLVGGMVVFLLAVMWLRGMEFRLRIFTAVFAGMSAWMGLITMAIWLWKEGKREERKNRPPLED